MLVASWNGAAFTATLVMLEVLLAVVGAARLSEGGFCSSSVRRVLDFGPGYDG